MKDRLIKSNVITRENLIEHYLKWKQIQFSQNSSALNSLFQGHFLVQINCENCKNESFAFQLFGELALDLLNLEKNKKIRQLFTKIYEGAYKEYKYKISRQKYIKRLTQKFGIRDNKHPSANRRASQQLKSTIGKLKIKKTKTSISSINFNTKNSGPQRMSNQSRQKNSSKHDSNPETHKKRTSSADTGRQYVRMSSKEYPKQRKKHGQRKFDPYRKNPFPDILLSDLIKDFFEPDYVKDYFCFQCRKKSTIKKSIYILQEPEILLISLKRFIYEPKPMKVNRPIFIYKDEVDLSEFLFDPEKFLNVETNLYDSEVSSGRRVNPEMTYNNSISFNRSIAQRSSTFEMTGYVEHIGGLKKGHYVSFVRNDVIQGTIKGADASVEKGWFLVNDEKIYKVENHSRKLIMYNPSVYSIFYKKKRNNL